MSVRGDSYCGIYCAACPVAVYGETGRADEFMACFSRIPKEELACGGCKSSHVYAGCRVCTFRDCARERGVDQCVACADYPCAAYRKWHAMKRLLPHVGEAPGSLEAIRRDGVDGWAAAQERRWACPSCGSRFTWYQRRCHDCGHAIGSASYELAGLRKLVGKVVLYGVYRKGKSRSANPNG
jgi:hypothetical protein